MKIENLKLSEIKPYERNPRKNDRAVEPVAESIRQFGFKQPIVIDKDGVIVAGHTRYKAALKLGLETVPCVRADDLTPTQVKAYRIADNKLNELATWDFAMLGDELETFEFDWEPLQFEMPEFNFNLNNVLEVRQKPGSTSATDSSPTSGSVAVAFNPLDDEERAALPEDLQGTALDPNSSPTSADKDETTIHDRVIIVYKKEDEPRVAKLLGLRTISKAVYTFEEINGATTYEK